MWTRPVNRHSPRWVKLDPALPKTTPQSLLSRCSSKLPPGFHGFRWREGLPFLTNHNSCLDSVQDRPARLAPGAGGPSTPKQFSRLTESFPARVLSVKLTALTGTSVFPACRSQHLAWFCLVPWSVASQAKYGSVETVEGTGGADKYTGPDDGTRSGFS